VFEVNEAFAAQLLAVRRELGFPPEKTNPNGSGISLGHPLGATGAIITVKALHELQGSVESMRWLLCVSAAGKESRRSLSRELSNRGWRPPSPELPRCVCSSTLRGGCGRAEGPSFNRLI